MPEEIKGDGQRDERIDIPSSPFGSCERREMTLKLMKERRCVGPVSLQRWPAVCVGGGGGSLGRPRPSVLQLPPTTPHLPLAEKRSGMGKVHLNTNHHWTGTNSGLCVPPGHLYVQVGMCANRWGQFPQTYTHIPPLPSSATSGLPGPPGPDP